MTQRSGRKQFRERLERMVNEIRQRIYNAQYGVGTYLPSEKTFAKEYQVSNKTVRQGMERLREERLIETIPRVGHKVISQSGTGVVTLRFGYYSSLIEEATLHRLIDMFHAAYPAIQIQAETISASHYRGLSEHVADMDVVTLNLTHFHEIASSGHAMNWETLEPDGDHYSFLHGPLSHDGELKVRPLIFSPVILCYNKQHFRELQMEEPDSSWNWDRLQQAADKLAEEYKRLGFYFHFLSANRWPIFLLQSGYAYSRDRQAGSEDPAGEDRRAAMMRGLDACRELIRLQDRFPLVLSEKDSDAEELFFAGKVSMIMTSYFSLNHRRQPSSVSYDLAPLPHLDEPGTLLLIIGMALNKRSRNKACARLFIDFMTSYEAQLVIRQETLSIPASKRAAEWTGQEGSDRPSRYPLYRELIPTFRVFTDLNLRAVELTVFLREAKLYWSGLETGAHVAANIDRALCHVQHSQFSHPL